MAEEDSEALCAAHEWVTELMAGRESSNAGTEQVKEEGDTLDTRIHELESAEAKGKVELKRWCGPCSFKKVVLQRTTIGQIRRRLGLMRRWRKCQDFGCLSKGLIEHSVTNVHVLQGSSTQTI